MIPNCIDTDRMHPMPLAARLVRCSARIPLWVLGERPLGARMAPWVRELCLDDVPPLPLQCEREIAAVPANRQTAYERVFALETGCA